MEQNKEQRNVYLKLLELDLNTIDSVAKEGPAVEQDVDIEEPIEMSEDEARATLCTALTYHLSSIMNLIFG